MKEFCDIAGVHLQIIGNRIELFEELITPTYLRANSEWSVEQVKSLKNTKLIDKSNPQKILLLRKGKARSDDHFEESLKNLVFLYGYKEIDPENYSCIDQISLFSNATEIIAIHGAALSNLVFSNADCKVFEIFNHPYRTYFFRELARINGNSYASSEMDSGFTKLKNWLSNS